MDFAKLQNIVGTIPRFQTYTRTRIAQLWVPGGPSMQAFKDHTLTGAMMNEAEEFIDRAIVLFLLRLGLRTNKYSTWADVSIYYANYFLAGAFQRICLSSFTHGSTSATTRGNYSIAPNTHDFFEHQITLRNRPFNHVEMWDSYYKTIDAFSWANGPSKDSLLPPASKPEWAHRERKFREERNYTPGQGFQELYQTDRRYFSEMAPLGTINMSQNRAALDESEYCDRSAHDRIVYLLKLLRALESRRIDPEFDVQRRQIRLNLISKYATKKTEENHFIAVIQGRK